MPGRSSGDGKFVYVSNRGHDSISVTWTLNRGNKTKTGKQLIDYPKDPWTGIFYLHGRLFFMVNVNIDPMC